MNMRQIKIAIKSNRVLSFILCPIIVPVRTIKRILHKNALKSFREYCSSISKTVAEPIFVKVGANDGVTGDHCSDILLSESSWKGLLIEPVPYCFARLKENFSDSQRFTLEQVAVGASNGEATFYYVSPDALKSIPDLPNWFDQLGSFDRQHIVKQLDGILIPFIRECIVQVRPLSSLLAKHHIQTVHLLHIDTEGHDFEVIKTLDLSVHLPVAIFIEHKHLNDKDKSTMFRLFRNHGYSVHNCGSDYFAINKDAHRRLSHTLQ